MVNKFNTYNESVRDFMKPKSKEELDVVWEKYKDIIKFLKSKYPANAYHLLPNGKLKINWNTIVKKYGEDKVEDIRINIMKLLKEYGMHTCYDRMYNEETFQKRSLGELPVWTNESVRDFLKPVSKDEIDKKFLLMSNDQLDKVLDDLLLSHYKGKRYKIVNDYLTMENPTKEKKIDFIKRLIAEDSTNESVRDMMKPMSSEKMVNVYMDKITPIKDSPFSFSTIPQDLCDAFGETMDNLYYISTKINIGDMYDMIDTILRSMIDYTDLVRNNTKQERHYLKAKLVMYTTAKIAYYETGYKEDRRYLLFSGDYLDAIRLGVEDKIQSKVTNESVRDMMKPMSNEVIESMFPPIVDKVKTLLDKNNIKYEIGLERLYSDAPVEIYFEIGKVSFDLEIFNEGKKKKRYRLGTFATDWKKEHWTDDEDDMVNYIKGLLPVKEGSETVGIVGSGTAVSGYPNGNTFTKSAGQAVYGWDSDSAFAGGSNNTSVKIEVAKNPKVIFKDVKKKKKRKDKNTIYNQIGKDIDKLHKPMLKTNNEHMIKKFEDFSKLNEDGEGGGVSSATLGNTGGMGAIVSAQPSSIPGDVAGSTKGSGDVGQVLGTYMKQPAVERKKKKKKDKEMRKNSQVGAGIDKFYVTNYKESNVSNGNLIQSWQAFTESKGNDTEEKDMWWERNYDKLIDIVSTWSENDLENLMGEERAELIFDETPKNKAFYVFNELDLVELDSLLGKYLRDIDESKDDDTEEKDEWWDNNYERLIKFVDESPIPMEMVLALVPNYETNWNDSTGKHNALAFLNMFTIDEIEEELRQFEETDDIDFNPYDNDDMYADDEEMNESKHYFTSNLEPGKIYEVTEPFELFIQVDEDTKWGGNLGQVTPIVKKIQTKIGDTISTHDLFIYSRPKYNDETFCFMHIPKSEGMFVKSRPKYDEFPLDKMRIVGEEDKTNEGYLSVGNAVKVTYPKHKDVDKVGIITDRDGDFLTVDLGTHKIKINASSIVDLSINESTDLKIGNKYLFKKDGDDLTVHIGDIEGDKITLVPVREKGKTSHGPFRINIKDADKLFKISW